MKIKKIEPIIKNEECEVIYLSEESRNKLKKLISRWDIMNELLCLARAEECGVNELIDRFKKLFCDTFSFAYFYKEHGSKILADGNLFNCLIFELTRGSYVEIYMDNEIDGMMELVYDLIQDAFLNKKIKGTIDYAKNTICVTRLSNKFYIDLNKLDFDDYFHYYA